MLLCEDRCRGSRALQALVCYNCGFSFLPKIEIKKSFSRTHPSSLTLKGGSTSLPKPLSPQRRGDVIAPARRSDIKVGGASKPSPVSFSACAFYAGVACIAVDESVASKPSPVFCRLAHLGWGQFALLWMLLALLWLLLFATLWFRWCNAGR